MRWIDKLRAGDIIKFGENLRIVLEVKKFNSKVQYVTFIILRCSWTRRPYTVYSRREVLARGKPLHKRVNLKRQPFATLVNDLNAPTPKQCVLQCDDVVGVNFVP